MSRFAPPLHKYKNNLYSENGEDGILLELLSRLKIFNHKDIWCVEFGAWDGIRASNTFALVEKGASAVYIEGNPFRFKDLLKTQKRFRNIIAINAFISPDSKDKNSLDTILHKTRIPINFDVLSIDIDSYDCDVWESCKDFMPKIIIIEINSSIPPGVLLRHGKNISGNSFSSTLNVGTKKGYKLVSHTGNLIFLRNDLINMLDFPARFLDNPELLFDSEFLSKRLFPIPLKSLFYKFIPVKLILSIKSFLKS
jgi:hypothetical protein